MAITTYLFSFLGSVHSPAISACVTYDFIVQRLQTLLCKSFDNIKSSTLN